MVLNPDVDCLNYVNINNPKARGTVQNLILETPLKQARLDFFLVFSVLYTKIVETNILPGYRTDHSFITMSITMSNFTKGNTLTGNLTTLS